MENQKRGGRSRVRLVAMVAAVLLGALATMSAQAGWLGAASADVSPTPVAQVPSSLPAGGVQIQNQDIVLTPPTSTPSGAMSADQAIAAARVFATKPFPATALEAELTLPGSLPTSPSAAGSDTATDHVPVWLVTFTSPTPIDVSAGFAAVYVTHYSVAVNPVTGAFVLGFFTP
jgi:hypothetical protein